MAGCAYPLIGYARRWLPRTSALMSSVSCCFRNASNFASSTSLARESNICSQFYLKHATHREAAVYSTCYQNVLQHCHTMSHQLAYPMELTKLRDPLQARLLGTVTAPT